MIEDVLSTISRAGFPTLAREQSAVQSPRTAGMASAQACQVASSVALASLVRQCYVTTWAVIRQDEKSQHITTDNRDDALILDIRSDKVIEG